MVSELHCRSGDIPLAGAFTSRPAGNRAQPWKQKLVPRGPRIIDLDILFYGTSIFHGDGIEIPHPRMANRRFVLVPMAELAPGLRHAALEATIAELLAATPDKSIVRLWQAPPPNRNVKMFRRPRSTDRPGNRSGPLPQTLTMLAA